MTPLVFLTVAVAGGAGAALRFLLDAGIRRVAGERFPWGILIVNVTGAFALGILSMLPADEAWRWIVGTGLLGGYTTFSAVAATTVLLAEEGRGRAATVYAAASFVGSVVAATAGLALGSSA
ncbi:MULTISPECIES: CrcB family protein [Microbacterium]|uniref:fluoride efflux transporter FluC n=1 Tax=Microbacterium TaxID=33882 RepID=UPI0027847F3E|nr:MULTISPECIES: CrcB family protein [Microbacterium]MDQ1082683.1 CrcB protein [Microbacterium sp. SORGH_AS_0344]MDQ1168546.1 CrcB protein [Microbacterium proteolyticum]